jgi:hypothetical protein
MAKRLDGILGGEQRHLYRAWGYARSNASHLRAIRPFRLTGRIAGILLAVPPRLA